MIINTLSPLLLRLKVTHLAWLMVLLSLAAPFLFDTVEVEASPTLGSASPARPAMVKPGDLGQNGRPVVASTALLTTTNNLVYLPMVVMNERPPLINADFELGAIGPNFQIDPDNPLFGDGPANFNRPITQDSDFESGGWAEFSLLGYDMIFNPSSSPLALPIPAHSGIWAAWLGGDDFEISYVEQIVTVPLGRPFLTYYYWLVSRDFCGYDFGGVIVNRSLVVEVYTLCEVGNTNDWVRRVVNLSSFAGQTIFLQLRAETDFSFYSSLFIDDVFFVGSSGLGEPARPRPDFAVETVQPKSNFVPPADIKRAGPNVDSQFLLRKQAITAGAP